MEAVVLLLALVLMLVGLIGVVVPVLPGLLVVWLVGVATLLWQGTDPVGWWVTAWLTALFLAGTIATVVLPARRGRAGGADHRSLGAAAAGAVLGFVFLPVVGFLVGGLVGLYLGERVRLGEWAPARRSTVAVLGAYGVGVLIELVLGTVMVASWAVAVIARLG